MSSKYINWNDINDGDSDQEVDNSSGEEQIVKTNIKRAQSTPMPVNTNQSNIDQNLIKLNNSKGNLIWLYIPIFSNDKLVQSEKELRKSIDIQDKYFITTKGGWHIYVDREKAQKLITTGLRTENFKYIFYFSNKNQENLQRKYSNQPPSNPTKKYKEKQSTIKKQQIDQNRSTVKQPPKYKQRKQYTDLKANETKKQEIKIQEKVEEQSKPKKKKYVAKKKQEISSVILQQNETAKMTDITANKTQQNSEANSQVSKQKPAQKQQQIQQQNVKQQPESKQKIEQNVQQEEQQNQQQKLEKLKKKLKKNNKKNKQKKKETNDFGNNRFASLIQN